MTTWSTLPRVIKYLPSVAVYEPDIFLLISDEGTTKYEPDNFLTRIEQDDALYFSRSYINYLQWSSQMAELMRPCCSSLSMREVKEYDVTNIDLSRSASDLVDG